MLFHVSEESGIGVFEPKASEYTTEPVVWAIEERRLCNYLLPRDCPRVTYYAGPLTTAADAQGFLGSSPGVIAVESGWWEQVRSCRLYCYYMPPATFEPLDECGLRAASSCGSFRICGRCERPSSRRASSSR